MQFVSGAETHPFIRCFTGHKKGHSSKSCIPCAIAPIQGLGAYIGALLADVLEGTVPSGSGLRVQKTIVKVFLIKEELCVEVSRPLGEGGYKKVEQVWSIVWKRSTYSITTVALATPAEKHPNSVRRCHCRHQSVLAQVGQDGITEPGTLQIDGRCQMPVYNGDLLHTPLSVGEVFALADRLASRLQANHEKGVIHRDVKGANLLKGPDGWLLHDWDAAGVKRLFGPYDTVNHRYDYWSFAGRLGFITHADDVRGLLMTVMQALFVERNGDVTDEKILEGWKPALVDLALPEFKGKDFYGCRDYAGVELRLNIYGNEEWIRRFALYESVLKLAEETLKKETEWRDLLVQSTVCHFAGVKIAEYREKGMSGLKEQFEVGVKQWFLEEQEEFTDAEAYGTALIDRKNEPGITTKDELLILDRIYKYDALMAMAKQSHDLPDNDQVGAELVQELMRGETARALTLFPTAKEIGEQLKSIFDVYNKAVQ